MIKVSNFDVKKVKKFPESLDGSYGVYSETDNPVYFVGKRVSWWIKELKNSRSKFETVGRIKDNVYYPKDVYEKTFTQRRLKRLPQEQERRLQKTESQSKTEPPVKTTRAIADVKKVDSCPVLYEVAKQIGVVEDLQQTFGDQTSQILLSLAFFNTVEGSLVGRKYERWSSDRNLPYCEPLTDGKISEFLYQLGVKENQIDQFFKRRFDRYPDERFFSYDSTNFACKSNGVTHSAMGKGKHGEIRQQIGLALVYGHDTHQPFSFKLLKGNTNDQQTIEELIERCTELRTQHPDFCCHIADRGYFSETNLTKIKKANLKFIMAAKTSVHYIAQAIQKHKQSIFSSRHYIEGSNGDYGITEQHRLGTISSGSDVNSDSTVYLHLYFSCKNKVREVEKFNHDLDTFENLHRQGQGKIYGIQMSKTKEKTLSNFFVLDENNEVVDRRHNLIDEHISTLGFYANVTTWKTDATTAWRIYSGRDCIEKCFKFGKHDLQVDTVRIHSDEACTGKFLVYFIGLCCQEELKRRIALRTQKKLVNKIHVYTSLRDDGVTYEDILSELKGTRQRSYSNGKVLYDDISKEVASWLYRLGLKDSYMKNRPLYDKQSPSDA